MGVITQFSQLDLSKTYTYADCRTWEFPEYVELLAGKVLLLMAGRSPEHQIILANLLLALRDSPGDTTRDTRIKYDLYEENGVREYWIVYPGLRTVAAFTLQNDKYQLRPNTRRPASFR